MIIINGAVDEQCPVGELRLDARLVAVDPFRRQGGEAGGAERGGRRARGQHVGPAGRANRWRRGSYRHWARSARSAARRSRCRSCRCCRFRHCRRSAARRARTGAPDRSPRSEYWRRPAPPARPATPRASPRLAQRADEAAENRTAVEHRRGEAGGLVVVAPAQPRADLEPVAYLVGGVAEDIEDVVRP